VSVGLRTDIMWELYIYINARKAVLSPSGNNRVWVIRPVQVSDKQITGGQGELRCCGPVSNGKGKGHETGLFW
jgi:hypothetical protein